MGGLRGEHQPAQALHRTGECVSLEAVVGFVNRTDGQPVTRISAAARLLEAGSSLNLTANDKRFLKSLRISVNRGQALP